MTSPVAVVGLKWDGYDIQRADLDVFLEITEGLDELPELRTHQQVIPFRHGQRADMSYAHARPIVLSGLISGPSGNERSAYRAYVDEVKASFSPFRTGLLVATLEDGTTRWIHAMPLDMRYTPIVPGASNVSIELIAHDPFWYSAYGVLNLDSGVEMDDDELMDAGGEIVVPSGTTEVTFTNTGTAEVERIRARFIGASGGSVGIENLSTPELVGFSIAQTLAAGQRITVNNYHRTARRDLGAGQGNVRGSMTLRAGNRNGEYLRLLPGSNTLRILGAPAEARITFFPTWL